MDKVIFWLNFIGIYHDDSKETKAFFYLPFLYMYVALLFERLCILWLTNRLGCGYREIQKFTELETRQEFIKAQTDKLAANWGATKAIPYNPDTYK